MERADGLVPTVLRLRMGARSQRAFARELGISESLLSRVLRGQRVLGPRAAGLVAARYPELRGPLGQAMLPTPASEESA